MIYLRFENSLAPKYMTQNSAAADLRARVALEIAPFTTGKVPTGVWIERVDWHAVAKGDIPEIQIRARSGLALKHSIMLANGVGTVDADYPDEICVLLYNGSQVPFKIAAGDRIAQMALTVVQRFPQLDAGGTRIGGFGSTNVAGQL